jgi:hypothetical protein
MAVASGMPWRAASRACTVTARGASPARSSPGDHLDPVPDTFVDGVGQGLEVFDVADGGVLFHPMETLDDRPRDLRGMRLQALGQQGATHSNPLRPTIR